MWTPPPTFFWDELAKQTALGATMITRSRQMLWRFLFFSAFSLQRPVRELGIFSIPVVIKEKDICK